MYSAVYMCIYGYKNLSLGPCELSPHHGPSFSSLYHRSFSLSLIEEHPFYELQTVENVEQHITQ